MAKGFDLENEARSFAGQIQDVLNGTVCNGITIQAVRAGQDVFKIGYQLRSDEYRTGPIPLTIDAKKPTGYIGLSYSLGPDHEHKYLMVRSSVIAYCHDKDTEHPLLHYDYERSKRDGYPDSHLQVAARSAAWDAIRKRCGLDKDLGALHLPLGGRRFRPTVENLIQFLVAEKLATPRRTWRSTLRQSQERFDELQVAAAVRRNPEVARRVLGQLPDDRY